MERPELNEILLSSSKRALLQSKLDEAKARFHELTRYSIYGGTFQINRSLIQETRELVTGEPNILIDHYGYPVLIEEVEEFYRTINKKYKAAKQRFYIDVKDARETFAPDLFKVDV